MALFWSGVLCFSALAAWLADSSARAELCSLALSSAVFQSAFNDLWAVREVRSILEKARQSSTRGIRILGLERTPKCGPYRTLVNSGTSGRRRNLQIARAQSNQTVSRNPRALVGQDCTRSCLVLGWVRVSFSNQLC